MRESCQVRYLSILFLLSIISTASADTGIFSDQKPTGISVGWYQQELDMKVSDIDINVPGLTDALIDSVKSRMKSTEKVELLNLKLDHQLRPYLNIYGSIGKVTDTSRVEFTNLGFGISDLNIAKEGTAYTAGVTLKGQYGHIIPSLQFAHSQISLDGNSEDITVNALIPAVGWQTDYGLLTTSLIYQAVNATYSGNVTAPFLGEIPATVEAKNNDNVQIIAGWSTQLTKDLHLNTNAGLNGQKQFQVEINKRF